MARLTVAERDLFETTRQDWTTYELSYCPDREKSFEGYFRQDPDTRFSCHTMEEFRALIRADHVRRTGK